MDICSVAYLCLCVTNALTHKAKKNGISVPKYLCNFVGVKVKGAAYTTFMKLQRIIIESGAVEAIEWHASLGHRWFSWEYWLIQIGWCWRMCWTGSGRDTNYCRVDWRKLQHKNPETNPAFMKLQKIIIESGAVEAIQWHASLGHRWFSWESWLIQIGWCWRMCWTGCGSYTNYCSVDWRKLQHKKAGTNPAFMKLQKIIIESGAVKAIQWHASLGHRWFSWEYWLIQIGWCWRLCWTGSRRYTNYCSVDWRKLQQKKQKHILIGVLQFVAILSNQDDCLWPNYSISFEIAWNWETL